LEVSSARRSGFSETQSFPGSYESLARIGDFVRKFATTAGFESFAVYSIEMAVDEACSNIIEHAYGGEGRGSIGCTCSYNGEKLAITLKDKGRSFNPAAVPPPDLDQDLEDRQAHGLGLFFIRQWMDEVRFVTHGSENVLTLVKHK
jgi:serine/threonine-protein kinase RsbW